jgi:hypothetical protein
MPAHRREYKFNTLKDQIDDEPISDYVAIRLAVIRLKTLQKHREIYYNSDV